MFIYEATAERVGRFAYPLTNLSMLSKSLLLRLSLAALWLALVLIPYQSFSQTSVCSFDAQHAELAQSPGYELQMEQIQALGKSMMEKAKSQEGESFTSGPSYMVPVVFHVIHSGGAGNISNEQIEAQLDRLNAEFAGNPNSQTGASMDIQFCFAQINPYNITNWLIYSSDHPGITRHQSATNSTISTGGHANLVSSYGFPPEEYLNIYVVEDIDGGTLGYSTLTGGLGVVIEAQVVGDVSNPSCACTLFNNYDLGMALVHEVGHYFSLLHPWGFASGECQEDDNISDTPVTFGPNAQCPTGVNSCPESPAILDQVTNYMDYTYDACKNTFTDGQRFAAHAMIQTNGYISQLVSPQNLIRTGVAGVNGCINLGLVPNYELSNTIPCVGEAFDLTIFNDPANTLDFWEVIITNGSFTFTASGTNQAGNVTTPVTLQEEGSYTISITLEDQDFTPSSATTSFVAAMYVTVCEPICDGAYWYLSKGQSVDFGTRFNFSNGLQLESVEILSAGAGTGALRGGTYTYSNCEGGLFFTDGKDVRGANAAHITNGNDIFSSSGCQADFDGSRDRQSVIGVPNGNGEVTVFMVTDAFQNPFCPSTAYGLSYYTVDAANSSVTTAFPGTSPSSNYSFMDAITAIPHCQGAGTWIIVKGGSDAVDVNPGPAVNAENQVMAYLYDGSSLGSPVVSSSGPFLGVMNNVNSNGWTTVEASPDGRWVIFSYFSVSYIYEFNALTGQCSYKGQVPGTAAAFSASGDLLYTVGGADFAQYDFAAFRECCEFPEPELIPIGFPSPSVIQRGPDSKVYLWSPQGGSGVSVINTPDELIENGNFSAVNFIQQAYDWPGVSQGLSPFASEAPNFIESTSSQGVDFYCCVSNCYDVTFRAEGCAESYSWNLGNGAMGTGSTASTTYQANGVYTVILTTGSGMTVTKDIEIGLPLTPGILPEGNICQGPFMTYNTSLPGMEYTWSVSVGGTLTSDPSFSYATVNWDDPTVGGTICLIVTDPESGCSSDIICFDQEPCNPCTALTITAEVTAECDNDGTITLTVTGGSGQYIYVWTPSTLPSSSVQTGLAAGNYSVKVMDAQDENCVGELEIIVPQGQNCGGCVDPIPINFGLSPKPFCYESDDNFTYYYVNIHVPNWSGTQSVDFEFCGDGYEFSLGELLDPYVEVSSWVFELEGFLKIPTSSIPAEVCVSIPICIDGVEKCGQFCFDLESCEEECTDWDVDAQVTQTLIGPMNNEPCGIMGQGYNIYDLDFQINVTIPAGEVGDDFSVSIWSDVGQMCITGMIPPGVSNAPMTFTVPFNSFYNSNNAKHFCYHVKVKNESTYQSCVENFCVPLILPVDIDFPKGGYEGLDQPGKDEKSTEEDKALNVKGVEKTGEVFVQGIEDGFWSYEVYSITGQFMQQGQLSEEGTQVLNFSNLSTGYYVIRLQNSATHETQVEQFIRW